MKRFRKERIGSIVRDVVAEAVQQRLNDPRVSTLTTVTRVEMSGDLQFAKVYLSVPGGDTVERRTLTAIKHAGGFIQRLVARELSIRQCPQLHFDIDERAKRVRQMMDLLDRNRRERPELSGPEEADSHEARELGIGPNCAENDYDSDNGDRRTYE